MAQAQPARLWNRDFSLLWIGLVQSYFGDAFLVVGLTWMALEMTGSPAAAATILALQALPKLLGPLAGVIIDSANKRALMIGTDILRGLLLVLLFVLHMSNVLAVWHLYLMVVLLSALSLAYAPSLRMLLPSLVPDTQLPTANSALQFGQQGAMIIGMSVAGIALATVGAAAALWIDGISFLLGAALIWFVRFPSDMLSTTALGPAQIWSNLRNGVRYILGAKEVLSFSLLAFVLNLVLSPVNVIFPVFSMNVLGAGITGFGLLASAISIGLLLGSLVSGLVIADRLPYTYAILIGLLGMSLALFGLSLSKVVLLALVLTALLGMMAPIIQIPLVSRLQRSVPREYQGRVFATLDTFVTLAIPLAAALAGQALLAFPVTWIFLGTAIGVLLVAVVYGILGVRSYWHSLAHPVRGD